MSGIELGFNIANIVIAVFSLAATIILSIGIFWLQRRHEKEIEKIENQRRESEIEHQADLFITDNEKELDNLPWCVMANCLNKHKSHYRKIYNEFNRLNDEVQKAVLRKLKYEDLLIIKDDKWVDSSISSFEKDFIKFKFGENGFLYDGGKYLFRIFNYKVTASTTCNDLKIKPLLPHYYSLNYEGIGFGTYCWDYFREIVKGKSYPEGYEPFSLLSQFYHLRDLNEKDFCKIFAFGISTVLNCFYNYYLNLKEIDAIPFTDAQPEYLEDNFYEIFTYLYFVYEGKSKFENEQLKGKTSKN